MLFYMWKKINKSIYRKYILYKSLMWLKTYLILSSKRLSVDIRHFLNIIEYLSTVVICICLYCCFTLFTVTLFTFYIIQFELTICLFEIIFYLAMYKSSVVINILFQSDDHKCHKIFSVHYFPSLFPIKQNKK